jgi:hypothetical protein
MSIIHNPIFLAVGPEKTGTSWLYRSLRRHPQIKMPPIKELRYFYEDLHYPKETIVQRFARRGDWHNLDYRERLNEFINLLIHGNREALWYGRFLFGRRSLDWYLSLFPKDKISGDISPQYFSLPIERITKIRSILPDAKILIFLRDPIEWSWSFAKMSLIKTRKLEEITEAELTSFFCEYQKYYPTVAMIERWDRIFPENQIFLGFFDKLRDDPQSYYDDICDFIGVHRDTASAEKINPGATTAIPDHIRSFLELLWQEEIERLADCYDYPKRWLESKVD